MTEQIADAQPHEEQCLTGELRTLFLFEKLTDEQLEWLCQRGSIVAYPAGPVYRQDDPAQSLFVLLEGTVAMSVKVGDSDVETNRTDYRGVYSGAWRGFLDKGVAAEETYNTSMRAVTDCKFYVLPADDFAELMREWFPMALHLLEGVFYGGKRTQRLLGDRERLLAMGSLSAGLTHELNNPAGAAVRATSALRTRVSGMRHKLSKIADGAWHHELLVQLMDLQERAVDSVATAPTLSPLETSDREDELADWLEDHGMDNAYDLSPAFVAAGLDLDWFEAVLDEVGAEMLPKALAWLYYTVDTELLLNEISESTTRISSLVSSAKQYSQLDRAPFQVLDVHELLRSTLVMLSQKRGDIKVVKEFDPTLPKISGYGTELNQVWTNLIDNAISAMGGANGQGTLTLRTSHDDGYVLVEVGDTGSGIPDGITSRIFEPFFTTKPVGEGTGLGLDISWRIVVNKHHGDLTVKSEPGSTWFRVKLPIAGPPREVGDDELLDEEQ